MSKNKALYPLEVGKWYHCENEPIPFIYKVEKYVVGKSLVAARLVNAHSGNIYQQHYQVSNANFWTTKGRVREATKEEVLKFFPDAGADFPDPPEPVPAYKAENLIKTI